MLPLAAEPRVAQPGFLPSESGLARFEGRRQRSRHQRGGGSGSAWTYLNRPQRRIPIVSISRMTQLTHREVKWVAQGHTAG